MPRELEPIVSAIMTYQSELYGGMSKTRFSGVPYMSVASQSELSNFVAEHGLFENLPSHMWSTMQLAWLIKHSFSGLRACLNWSEVQEALLMHDVREFGRGDTTVLTRMETGIDPTKEERQDLLQLTSSLPRRVQERILQITDLYEGTTDKEPNLEVLFARFVDHIQDNHFVLTVGTSLAEYSETISRVLNRRTAKTSRKLLQALQERFVRIADPVYLKAAEEVKAIRDFIYEGFRKSGVQLSLDDS